MRSSERVLPAIMLCFVITAVAPSCSERTRGKDAGSAKPFPLMVGDPAPPLTVSRWIKGQPVARFEKGRIYVVDFWSTWCVPCVKDFPHLSQVQEQYDRSVTVVAVDIWELQPARVPAFVEQQGAAVTFSVCTDSVPQGKEANEGLASEQWLYGSGHTTIPLAFVIDRDSRVAWIGSPKEIDEPLKQVVDGTWDREAAASAFRMRKTEEAKAMRVKVALDHALSGRRWPEAAALADTVRSFGGDRSSGQAITTLCLIARSIADSGGVDRDLDLALRCAQQANEWSGGQDPWILSVVAKMHHLRGERDAAITYQTEAVARADEDMKADYLKVLHEYETER